MGIYIPAMSDHGLKLLVCFIVLLSARANGIMNITRIYSAVETGAVCLNGTPPSYYLERGSGDGANNWVLFLQGGAWCANETHCIKRALHDSHGGSDKLDNWTYGYYGLLNPFQNTNPEFYNWNKVFLNYCDLGSFTGDVEEVNPANNLHFRGSRVFNVIIEDLLAKGMKDAKNAILSGQSAGGLATILHCDQFREQLPNANRVKCLSDGGYFIRAKDLHGITEPLLEEPYLDLVALHGMAKFLPQSCTSRMEAKLCLYPENFIRDMKTPVFLVNSAFDSFQIKQKVMQAHSGWEACRDNLTCSAVQLQAMRELRQSFINALPKSDTPSIGTENLRNPLTNVVLPKSDHPSIGMFITSCYLHDQILDEGRWRGTAVPKLQNKTVAEAFGDWYFDRVSAFQEIDPTDTPIVCPY